MKKSISILISSIIMIAASNALALSCADTVGTWHGNMGSVMHNTSLTIESTSSSMIPNASITFDNGSTTFGAFLANCSENNGKVTVNFSGAFGQQYGSMNATLVSSNKLQVNANLIYGGNGSGTLSK